MKLKNILIAILLLLIVMALVACNPPSTKGPGTDDPVTITPLDPLTDYSSETKYHAVTSVVYTNTEQQRALLQERINERPQPGVLADKAEYDDLSVPVKIFVNSEPADIILEMGNAALSFAKMDATVQYLAGVESAGDLDAVVATGVWVDNRDWSFFDDWDYLEKLQDRMDALGSTDSDSDNVQRQKRKMMGQVFSIGMTGDEFARLVIQQLQYAQRVTNTMHLEYDSNMDYDDYVKEDLSYDTLVYFKAFNSFVGQSKAQTVQLYGYYYDYNKKAYDTKDDTTFEKELTYSHMKIFSDAQFIEYVKIQRDNYINSYRYTPAFYQSFYQVHFKFQDLLENFDLVVFADPISGNPMETALTDTSLKYSSEMKKGMEAGFAQQLILTDHLYVYGADDTKLRAYNTANTGFELVKNSGSQPKRDEMELALNIEKLKVVDYILTSMTDSQLSAVLRYHIMTYSGDMIRNIQSEKKDVVLEKVEKNKIEPNPINESVIKAHDVTIGRTNAIISQLGRSYGNAGPKKQFDAAATTNWKGIRPEIKAVLDHDYSKYSNGTAKLEAFEDNLIKKKQVNPDGSDYKPGVDDSALVREEYDIKHEISRFLNNHETVLRYSIGQVQIELAGQPGNNMATNTAYNLSTPTNYSDGTYRNSNNLDDNRNMPDGGVTPTNYPNTVDSVTFNANLTIIEGLSADNANMPNFLTGNAGNVAISNQIYGGGMSAASRAYSYQFEGWYIDIELKFKIDTTEKLRYDLILYPGYIVTKAPVTV